MTFPLGNRALPGSVYWFTALAFGLRAGTRLYAGAEDFFVNGYTFFFAMAQNIAAGNGIGFAGQPLTAFRVPLYSIFLAAVTMGHKWFWPVVAAQSLVGAGTVLSAAWLAREMFGNRAAILVAGITAVYPYYVIHDTALQETSMFTLITLGAVITLWRARQTGALVFAVASGVLLGLDVLTRSTIAPFAVIAPVWLAWSVHMNAAKSIRRGVICALALALVVSPWLWRNYKLTGVPTLATEVGMEVWNGNNALLFRYYPEQSSDLSKAAAFDALSPEDRSELEQLGENEALLDRWFLRRGLSYIQAHPWLTVTNAFRKVGAGFGWLPSPRRGFWPNLGHAITYGPVMLLGLYGMWMRREHWRTDSHIYALFALFTLVTAVFFAHSSHRTYLDVYWIVYAAGVLSKHIWPASSDFHRVI